MKRLILAFLSVATTAINLDLNAAAANVSRASRAAAQTLRQQLRNKSLNARRADVLMQQAGQNKNLINSPYTTNVSRFPAVEASTLYTPRDMRAMDNKLRIPAAQENFLMTPEQQRKLQEEAERYAQGMESYDKMQVENSYMKLQEARERYELAKADIQALAALEIYGFITIGGERDPSKMIEELKSLSGMLDKKLRSIDPLDFEQQAQVFIDYADKIQNIPDDLREAEKLKIQMEREKTAEEMQERAQERAVETQQILKEGVDNEIETRAQQQQEAIESRAQQQMESKLEEVEESLQRMLETTSLDVNHPEYWEQFEKIKRAAQDPSTLSISDKEQMIGKLEALHKNVLHEIETGSSWRNTIRDTVSATKQGFSNAKAAVERWWNNL